jgi:hypothetical protein
MSTVVAGNAAEAAVLKALSAWGLAVLLPFGSGLPFDLAAVLPSGQIARIQVKAGRVRRGGIEFNSASTDHGQGQRHYRGRVDLIAVSVPALDRVFMIPVDDCPISRGFLRLEAARNNQQRRVRLAEGYAFEAWAASREAAAEGFSTGSPAARQA